MKRAISPRPPLQDYLMSIKTPSWLGVREHAKKIITFKKYKIKLLTNEQQEPYENAKLCYICKENFENKYSEGKNYDRVGDHCHYAGENTGTVQSICNFKKYSILKKLSVIFHIDLIMIIMKELEKVF